MLGPKTFVFLLCSATAQRFRENCAAAGSWNQCFFLWFDQTTNARIEFP